jgi:membrane protease subunit HflK
VDRVERIPVARVFETELRDLHYTSSDSKVTRYLVTNRATLDPERTGYALTGDQNIVHIAMVARWQVGDPIAWIQEVADPEAQLRLAVLSSTVQTLGGTTVDTVLSDGRQDMVDSITRRAQTWLDTREAGVSIVSLELIELGPPQQVQEAFRDVQTAAIESETRMRSAQEYQEVQVPKARTDKRRVILAAEAESFAGLQQARSEASAFEFLVTEYRKDPGVVRERLYREGLEAVLEDAGKVDFLPPPEGGRYTGTRLTIPVDGLQPAKDTP